MNKFIALALFALCATMAHGQVIYPINNLGLGGIYSHQNGGAASGSDASASAQASTSSNSASHNNGVISSNFGGPVLGVGPYGTYGAPIIAGPYAPNGYVSPLAAPWVPQGYPIGPVGPIGYGPCGQGVVSF